MSEERRQSSKLWEPGSFDARKNAAAPMIAMLGRSELDTEVSDAGMETAESDDCRGVSKKDRDANGVKIVDGGLYFIFSFLFLFYFSFLFLSFNFLFLEQLGLGIISHAVTSVIT